jgi:hypothetical protein
MAGKRRWFRMLIIILVVALAAFSIGALIVYQLSTERAAIERGRIYTGFFQS